MSIKREIRDYLQDIVQAVSDIRAFTEGMTFERFAADRKTIHAVIRSLEIIGEATKKVPSEVRDRRPDLPWLEIAAMRDKLIHEYFGVDLEIVWETIANDLAPLEDAIRNLLSDLE